MNNSESMNEEKDFHERFLNVKETEIQPTGWYQIKVEYGLRNYGASDRWELCWRVQGTEHIFRIMLDLFYEDSQGDYEKHFTKVLEVFRKDYLDWYKQGFPEDWMRKYKKQFGKFIYTFS